MLLAGLLLLAAFSPASAQPPTIQYGTNVPPEVKRIYDRGLAYLASTQQEDGSWSGGQSGTGITGLCLMAFLANGEDPNFGKYSLEVQRCVRNIISSQDASTGYLPNSMYHHGFAMLGLSEAYGTVDESLVWPEGADGPNRRTIGQALELAVRCAVTSQKKNQWGGWRYSPDSTDADTSVSGAVLMGLLAARNAGIEVPDETIDKALDYFRSSTSDSGSVAYAGGIGGHGASMNRTAIAALVLSIGKRREWTQFDATVGHLTSQLEHQESGYPFYFRYYMAQALFQGDFDAWTKWKRENVIILRDLQQDDGSFNANHGVAYGTAMSLLALALDYRFLPIYER
ncbi:MAG: prenyltransferase/squalene oxidase repeat-containing protein [Pirellulales bacterium]